MPGLTIFLGGDVMTGRGIDQILPHPSEPTLHETSIRDARDYVRLAEMANGSIPRPATPTSVWGEALAVLAAAKADARIVNLETSVTRCDQFWAPKDVHYRMEPANIGVLTCAGLDVVSLANNHVLDWGRDGLIETLQTLEGAGIRSLGAGRSLHDARRAAILDKGDQGRILVVAGAFADSGVPTGWEATATRAGVHIIPRKSASAAREWVAPVLAENRDGDRLVASIHWGSNWGYEVTDEFVSFAHSLINLGVDVVFGHSSHHFRPIEVYRGRPILYGAGDLINDYEGIEPYEGFRHDLSLMYFVDFDDRLGPLSRLTMAPMRVRRFRLERASPEETDWVCDTLTRICRPFVTSVERRGEGELSLHWS